MADQHGATLLAAVRGVVIDTETTGLDARVAKIVQIGGVRVEGGRVIADAVYDQLVNPGILIPPETTAVHGLGDADVAHAPTFAAVADPLQAFVGSAVLIGHTIGYDLTLLRREYESVGKKFAVSRALDIRLLAELALPGLAQYDLERIAAILGVAISGRHTALGDARGTAECFVRLVPKLRDRNIRTLGEVEAAVRELADRQASAGQSGAYLPPAADMQTSLRRIDSFPYRHRVGDIMSVPAVFADAGTPLGAVVKDILERKISSVIIRDGSDTTQFGLLTERDLLRAIVRHGGEALGMSAGTFASRPLQSVKDSDFVYRAIGRVTRLGIRHLAVRDGDGTVVGMVTTRNLLRHRATTAIALGDEIDVAASEGDLAHVWGQLSGMVRSLVDEGVEARTTVAVISTEISALTRRAAEIAEAGMVAAGKGPAPVPYAVLVLGSAGRGESLLAADQDNAIVHAAATADGPEDRWFAELATEMNRILDVAGVVLCKGGVMAKNAPWRGNVAAWRERVESWVRRQRPEDLLNVDIFFDGVIVHGDEALGGGILDHAHALARKAPDFQVQLAQAAQRWSAPTSLFGGIKTESDGRVDAKKFGLLPIFTAGRVLAIRHGIAARGTADRLRAIKDAGVGSASDIEALIDAHGTILSFMLRQQLKDSAAGVRLTPRVDVKGLDPAEKAELKSAFGRVSIATDLVSEGRS
jgi:DNA polymerase-3 subunit epsilon/CBS domain-containing protein